MHDFFSFGETAVSGRNSLIIIFFADISEDTIIQKTPGTFSPAQAQNLLPPLLLFLLLLLLLAPKVPELLAD